jgi:hypothetical protein
MKSERSDRKSLITSRIRENLFELALQPCEEEQPFGWHSHAAAINSSQAFCLSAFGSLRHKQMGEVRDSLVAGLVSDAFPDMRTAARPRRWAVDVEFERPDLLNEQGRGQPSAIDAVLTSSEEVVVVESKFATDAKSGFGGCGQYHTTRGPRKCSGFYGPGSDIAGASAAWCRLESWDGTRSPRLYWSMAKAYCRPEVFARQTKGGLCPFRDSTYQLLRNFLFAAAFAAVEGKSRFGVIVICPRARETVLSKQIADFRSNVLAPVYGGRVQLVHYDKLIRDLNATGHRDAVRLGKFLSGRMAEVLEL